jgi:hypothetical protein
MVTVGAFLRRPRSSTKSATEHLSEHVVRVEAWGHPAALGTVRVPKLVEILALLRVGQNIIRSLDLLELLWIATLVRVRP